MSRQEDIDSILARTDIQRILAAFTMVPWPDCECPHCWLVRYMQSYEDDPLVLYRLVKRAE